VARLQDATVLTVSGLAIDGNDLIRELGLEPGPEVGRLLDALLQAVIEDPGLNEREALLRIARQNRTG
jgi:tRNA nucleotidyltransferase (CCA-adding enzyme)